MKRKVEADVVCIVDSDITEDGEGLEFYRPTRREFLVATVAVASGLSALTCASDDNGGDSGSGGDSDVDSDVVSDTSSDSRAQSDPDVDVDTSGV